MANVICFLGFRLCVKLPVMTHWGKISDQDQELLWRPNIPVCLGQSSGQWTTLGRLVPFKPCSGNRCCPFLPRIPPTPSHEVQLSWSRLLRATTFLFLFSVSFFQMLSIYLFSYFGFPYAFTKIIPAQVPTVWLLPTRWWASMPVTHKTQFFTFPPPFSSLGKIMRV